MKPGAVRALTALGCGIAGIILYAIQTPFHYVDVKLGAAQDAILAYAERITGTKL